MRGGDVAGLDRAPGNGARHMVGDVARDLNWREAYMSLKNCATYREASGKGRLSQYVQSRSLHSARQD